MRDLPTHCVELRGDEESISSRPADSIETSLRQEMSKEERAKTRRRTKKESESERERTRERQREGERMIESWARMRERTGQEGESYREAKPVRHTILLAGKQKMMWRQHQGDCQLEKKDKHI